MFAIVSSVFSGVFASVSDICFKCFICLHMYVASVASGCFKSRLVVVSPSLPSVTSPRCLLLAFCCLASFSDYRGSAAGAGGRGAPAAQTRAHALPLCGQVKDIALLSYYCEQHKIRLPLVELFNSWLVEAASRHVLSLDAGRPRASISDRFDCSSFFFRHFGLFQLRSPSH
jgi:hypothetical protein